MEVASLDESNAFSYVITPPWFWAWFAAPPMLAIEVWDLLPKDLQSRCRYDSWVAPQYRRLAVGFTHLVHILMSTNEHQHETHWNSSYGLS